MARAIPPPADPSAFPGDVLTELRRRYDDLTHSQKRIAEAIVGDPDLAAFATLDGFAAKLGVSPSTIVRFSYRIGLSGYADLQERVRALVLARLRTAATRAEPAQPDGEGVAARSLRHDLDLMRRAGAEVNVLDVERAADLLVEAGRVHVAGGLTAYGLAHYAATAMDRIRPQVVLLDVSPVPTGHLLEMGPGDALLSFAFPPYARSTVRLVEESRRRGARVIAVSDSPLSPIARDVAVVLPVAVNGMGVQNSPVAALSLAVALVNTVAARSAGAAARSDESVQLLEEMGGYVLDGSPPVPR